MSDEHFPTSGEADAEGANQATGADEADRRELIRKLGKTAALPLLVASFIASDSTDLFAEV